MDTDSTIGIRLKRGRRILLAFIVIGSGSVVLDWAQTLFAGSTWMSAGTDTLIMGLFLFLLWRGSRVAWWFALSGQIASAAYGLYAIWLGALWLGVALIALFLTFLCLLVLRSTREFLACQGGRNGGRWWSLAADTTVSHPYAKSAAVVFGSATVFVFGWNWFLIFVAPFLVEAASEKGRTIPRSCMFVIDILNWGRKESLGPLWLWGAFSFFCWAILKGKAGTAWRRVGLAVYLAPFIVLTAIMIAACYA